MTIHVVDAGSRQISRSAIVNAPPAELFALVADARRHSEIDGSQTVRTVISGPARLSAGARFSMNMKAYGLRYRITNQVTAYEENRLIEWRHPVGHRWRWRLDTRPDGTTLVTEIFDYSQAGRVKNLIRYYDLIRATRLNAGRWSPSGTSSRSDRRNAPNPGQEEVTSGDGWSDSKRSA
jgi:ribosome-associated toxin RatA of RatAB toxin-antitoxin module